MRGLPQDVVGAPEFARASFPLKWAHQELRPPTHSRVYAYGPQQSPADAVISAAFFVRMPMDSAMARSLAEEAVKLGLWRVTPAADGGGVLEITALPPSVLRRREERYLNQRGARGGKGAAERQAERRQRERDGNGSAPPVPPLGSQWPAQPSDEGESEGRDVPAAPVTGFNSDGRHESGRDSSVTSTPSPSPLPSPADTPPKGGVGWGEVGSRTSPPASSSPSGKIRRGEFGTQLVELLSKGTDAVFRSNATDTLRAELARIARERGITAERIATMAAHWRAEPEAWRAVLKGVPAARGVERLSLELLLKPTVKNQLQGDHLAALDDAAQSWRRGLDAAWSAEQERLRGVVAKLPDDQRREAETLLQLPLAEQPRRCDAGHTHHAGDEPRPTVCPTCGGRTQLGVERPGLVRAEPTAAPRARGVQR